MPQPPDCFSSDLTFALKNTQSHLVQRSMKREGTTADIRALEAYLLQTGIQEGVKLRLTDKEFPLPSPGACLKKSARGAAGAHLRAREDHFLHWTTHEHEAGAWRLMHEVYQLEEVEHYDGTVSDEWQLQSALPLIERPSEVRIAIGAWLPRFVYQMANILDTQEHQELTNSYADVPF